MTYYQIKEGHYRIATPIKAYPGHFEWITVIPGELYTGNELTRRGLCPRDHFNSMTPVSVSKREVFWSFGARFPFSDAKVTELEWEG